MYRCMQEGYTFIGDSRGAYWLTPEGMMVPLVIHDHIPYLCVGDPRCTPRPATAADYMLPMPAHIGAVGIEHAVEIFLADGEREEIHTHATSMPSAPARRDLGKEASHLSHLLTHMPANPHCEACIRAKMKQAQHRRGGYTLSLIHI